MGLEQRKAPLLLGTSVTLGILGELLFQNAAWGVNMFFWFVFLAAGALALAKWSGGRVPKTVIFSAPAVLLFAGLFALRDAPELKIANATALFLLIGAVLARTKAGNFAQASVSDLTFQAVASWFKLTSDFAHLITKEINWRGNHVLHRRSREVIRGGLIATPLLLIFGALFASADDRFGASIAKLFNFGWVDGDSLFQATVTFLFCAVLASGTYRMLLTERGEEPFGPPKPPLATPTLGATEVFVVLGSLNALFCAFVISQVNYFFGGVGYLRSVHGSSYTEYARHGFFELAIVVALAIATILGFHSLLQDPRRHRKTFAVLAGTLTCLVAVILASAFQRMGLYIGFAGLTELRLYTFAFMVWTGTLLLVLGATVVRGNRTRFAGAALATGLATILVLNAIDPDALIYRYNLSGRPQTVDLAYLGGLSVDAAPAALGEIANEQSAEYVKLRSSLRNRWSKEVGSDWRGLNLSRWQFLSRYRAPL